MSCHWPRVQPVTPPGLPHCCIHYTNLTSLPLTSRGTAGHADLLYDLSFCLNNNLITYTSIMYAMPHILCAPRGWPTFTGWQYIPRYMNCVSWFVVQGLELNVFFDIVLIRFSIFAFSKILIRGGTCTLEHILTCAKLLTLLTVLLSRGGLMLRYSYLYCSPL